ncbi:hypothetical protein NQ314_020483 [Rhamnusium bicolor]|uniref:Elongation factor EFG domain-containing protein n=1 Tax=Rhamnusium bicolor TaxID=1586634 RepID=A0AAV8WL35_9CUCU|nr:hypothetical protein NQ314_020483 [Rhamnusium bicolor]
MVVRKTPDGDKTESAATAKTVKITKRIEKTPKVQFDDAYVTEDSSVNLDKGNGPFSKKDLMYDEDFWPDGTGFKEYNRLLIQARYQNRLSNSDNKSKCTWDIVNEIRGKNKSPNNIPIEGDPTVIAKTFNNFITNTAPDLVVNTQVMLHLLEVGRGTSDTMIAATVTQLVQKVLLKEARTDILEPIMLLEVVTPNDHLSTVLADLSRRRISIKNITMRGKNKVVLADAPLSELLGYSSILRTLTSGTATFTMEFQQYEKMSPLDEITAIHNVRGF